MSMQIAQHVPFHPVQCPVCINYVPNINRCRAFAVESWPRPLLAVLGEESADPCPRFVEIAQTLAATPADAPPVEIESALANVQPVEAQAEAVQPAENVPAVTVETAPAETPQTEAPVMDSAEIATPAPVRGEARIHCQKCKAENPPSAARCQKCDAKLLPAEGAGARFTTFFSGLIAAGLFGYLLYRFYIQNPGSAPDIPFLDTFLNPVVLGLATVIAFITAIVVPLRKTPEYVKYINRAKRHIQLNPWQALADVESAMEIAPDKEQGNLLKQRAQLYEMVGFAEDAARDRLVLATAQDAFKGEADAAKMFTGADSGTYAAGRRSSQIKTILYSGKALAIGYCPKCNEVTVLDKDEHCPIHPKTKGSEVEYVIPADVLAGKLAVMQKVEAGKPKVAEQLTALLATGKASALGYCLRCRAVVELDSQRRCTLHPRARVKNVQYAVPRDLAAARKRIFKLQRGRRSGRNQTIFIAIALIIAALLLLNAYDTEISGIFQRLINSGR
ncbi:MAG: hypothetical protein ACYC3P_11370 [Bellilinea sp.]